MRSWAFLVDEEITPRAQAWAATMAGHPDGGTVRAHEDSVRRLPPARLVDRLSREDRERETLRPEATFAEGAGHRATPETPDDVRTCFERDRDRIVHSTAFRRLAGKTQVVVYPTDHQRTRLTDALALGHDCGHGPGGHASEEAFDAFLPEGYEHGPWGADVVLTGLNLCAETLDGIRN